MEIGTYIQTNQDVFTNRFGVIEKQMTIGKQMTITLKKYEKYKIKADLLKVTIGKIL